MSYIVGLGIEFAWAQWKGEEIQEGYLVSGFIIPLIIPIGCPLWMLALACAFSVIFCKEIFGGTGMNFFNPAIATRMFLFFAYPSKMTGDQIWVAQNSIFGLGNDLPDGFTAATPLGQIGQGLTPDASLLDMALGFIPGSIGETSLVAIAIGAFMLLRVYGYRPRDIVPHNCRSVYLRFPDWRDGHHHPCDECRLSRGYDARHLLW